MKQHAVEPGFMLSTNLCLLEKVFLVLIIWDQK